MTPSRSAALQIATPFITAAIGTLLLVAMLVEMFRSPRR